MKGAVQAMPPLEAEKSALACLATYVAETTGLTHVTSRLDEFAKRVRVRMNTAGGDQHQGLSRGA